MKNLIAAFLLLSATLTNPHGTFAKSPLVIFDTHTKGSLAGMYVMQFAGANTHFYELKFKQGKYTGSYEEYQDNKHTRKALQNLKVNEGGKTISFQQGKKTITAKITDEGLAIGDDIYSKR